MVPTPFGNCALVNLDLQAEHMSFWYSRKYLGESLHSMACQLDTGFASGTIIDAKRTDLNGE